jgi:adenosylmethionine-8-amino-7-oxononanoate aminotransferase
MSTPAATSTSSDPTSEFWSETPAQEAERSLQHLRRTIEAEGPQSVAAVLLETIPGTAGIRSRRPAIQVVPPAVVTAQEVATALSIYDDVLSTVAD